jgi:hypothetical protein
MSAETVAPFVLSIVSASGTVLVGLALLGTWRRNGKEQRSRDDAHAIRQALRDKGLELGYRAITDRLDDRDSGLSAINSKIAAQATHCAEVTGRYDERINSLENG